MFDKAVLVLEQAITIFEKGNPFLRRQSLFLVGAVLIFGEGSRSFFGKSNSYFWKGHSLFLEGAVLIFGGGSFFWKKQFIFLEGAVLIFGGGSPYF